MYASAIHLPSHRLDSIAALKPKNQFIPFQSLESQAFVSPEPTVDLCADWLQAAYTSLERLFLVYLEE